MENAGGWGSVAALSVEEMIHLCTAWQQPAPRYTRGVLAKYARTVSSASTGAVTDAFE